ncbi:MAG: protein kinase [Elusimicrobia bacterium]|nr:protein kinase [Elusimicrobiota bacterium]
MESPGHSEEFPSGGAAAYGPGWLSLAAGIGLMLACGGPALAAGTPDPNYDADIQMLIDAGKSPCSHDPACTAAAGRISGARPEQWKIHQGCVGRLGDDESQESCLREAGLLESVSKKGARDKFKAGDKEGACSDAKAAVAEDAGDDASFAIAQLSCSNFDLKEPPKTPAKNPFGETPRDDLEKGPRAKGVSLETAGAVAPLRAFGMPDKRVPMDPQMKASDLAAADARTFLEAGNIDEAIRRALAALKANPKNRRARLMLAYADKAKKDWPAVIKDAKEGLALKPDDPQFLKLEADAENHLKLCKEAFQTSGRAVAADPTDATAYAIKAWSLGCLGDREGMLALLKKAVALDPKFQMSLESAADLEGDSDLFFLMPGEQMPAGKKQPAGPTRTQALGIAGGLALVALVGIVGGMLRLMRPRGPAQGTPGPAEPIAAVKAAPPQAASPEAGAASVPDRYDIRQKIGEGGMGVVFGGFDRELMRAVAIKKMRPELKENKENLKRFLAEARSVAELSHPFIVSIHDIVQKDGDVFLVFEYVDGKPLSSILNSCKRMTFTQCRDIFSYICQAMDCAHKAKVLHLDLKPGNIMVDHQGFVKVMDFGLARHAKDSLSRMTRQDMAGTLAYMAPEQHRGAFCPASDVYAMGVCLYEMLTGTLPFSGPDFLAAKESLSHKPPLTLAPDIPKGLETVFADVFTPDPKSRLADSMEFLRRLKEL